MTTGSGDVGGYRTPVPTVDRLAADSRAPVGAAAEPTVAEFTVAEPEPTVAEIVLPPLVLRDGLPSLTDSFPALADTLDALAAGTGPIAIDTERASGYRYSQRAYLVQLRRAGSGTFLVDPIAVPGVPGLAEVLAGPEWILHAASQDLPCLTELGLHADRVFDTELAGRLLGMPRVGLAPMVEELLGHSLAKGHGAADWSTRPLPTDWLEYAALDVEVLLELREELTARLVAAGKLEWAYQEFDAARDAGPAIPRTDPWRRTSGIHRVRSRRGLAIVAQLWLARDRIAREVDTAPGRLLPDSALVVAGAQQPRDLAAMLALKGFHGRGVSRHRSAWGRALAAAWAIPEADLPSAANRSEGPPPARAWAQRDPAAAARLDRARASLQRRAEELVLPVENLLSPDLVRRLMWQPPADCLAGDSDAVAAYLHDHGARAWQVEQATPLLAAAMSSVAE